MSIFGTSAPKFIAADSTEVLLDYVLYRQDYEHNIREHKSGLNRNRSFYNRGTHIEFTGTIYLYKYGDPALKLRTLDTYRNTLVTLYRHRDGEPYQTPDEENVPFLFIELFPYYVFGYTDPNLYDVADFRFISLNPVDVSQSAQPPAVSPGTGIVTPKGIPIVTPKGEEIETP